MPVPVGAKREDQCCARASSTPMPGPGSRWGSSCAGGPTGSLLLLPGDGESTTRKGEPAGAGAGTGERGPCAGPRDLDRAPPAGGLRGASDGGRLLAGGPLRTTLRPGGASSGPAGPHRPAAGLPGRVRRETGGSRPSSSTRPVPANWDRERLLAGALPGAGGALAPRRCARGLPVPWLPGGLRRVAGAGRVSGAMSGSAAADAAARPLPARPPLPRPRPPPGRPPLPGRVAPSRLESARVGRRRSRIRGDGAAGRAGRRGGVCSRRSPASGEPARGEPSPRSGRRRVGADACLGRVLLGAEPSGVRCRALLLRGTVAEAGRARLVATCPGVGGAEVGAMRSGCRCTS